MAKQNVINMIDAKISTFEAEVKAGKKFKEKDAKKLRDVMNNTFKIGGLTEEEKQPFNERIEAIITEALKDDKFIDEVSPKNIVVKSEDVEKIAENAKKTDSSTKKKLAALGIAIALGVGAFAIGHATGSNDDAPAATEASIDDEDKNIVNEDVQYTEMDAEYKELSDNITASMNDSISKGLVVTEENKEVLVKQYVEYYMLNRMDTLTDEQWGNVFQNSTITAEDIMNAKYALEWEDEKRATVGSKDMMLNYNLMFDGLDAELLNDAANLLNDVKTTEGKERKEAIAKFKEYIITKLNNNTYSERALDTFRAVYFDAFDELTNHAEIDDELEHAVNTTITCSLNDSDLDVMDATIQSLQSDFQTYEAKKLELRLQNGWTYVANNKVNPYNDIEEITKYVAGNIDLSLYRELPDYEQTLTNMFLKDSPVPSNNVTNNQPDSGKPSTNEPGPDNGGQDEGPETTTDVDGNEVDDPEMLQYYTQLGAEDYYNGTYDESKVPEQYRPSYRNGRDIAKAAEEEARKNEEETEEFVPVDNGETTTEEEIETDGYTEQPTNDDDTTFIPVENGEETTEEVIETEDYTTYYEIEPRELEMLENFKNELLAITEESVMEESYTESNTLTKQK